MSRPVPLINFENGRRRYTRDVLYVKGLLDDDTVHVMVNHWPSRGGGPITANHRNNGAILCRNIVDSLINIVPDAKIFVMGDLNDDPTDESIKSYLRAVDDIRDVNKTGMFNPYEDMFRRGQGSNAYRDAWSLFDQIIISKGVAGKKQKVSGILKPISSTNNFWFNPQDNIRTILSGHFQVILISPVTVITS